MQPQDLQNLLGENVRRRRRELRLTQEQLASRAGIAQGYLSQIEAGKRSVLLGTVADIATALSVTPSYLLAGQPVETT